MSLVIFRPPDPDDTPTANIQTDGRMRLWFPQRPHPGLLAALFRIPRELRSRNRAGTTWRFAPGAIDAAMRFVIVFHSNGHCDSAPPPDDLGIGAESRDAERIEG